MTSEYQSLSKKVSKVSILSAILDTEEDPAQVKQDIEQIEELISKYNK